MRYAVYFCPAEGSGLDVFGREWLATKAVPGITPENLQALLADVRRYGWHATLSAPFALADGVNYDGLRRNVAEIARQHDAFDLPLQLDALAGFLALRPAGDETAIHALAERCVRMLQPLRAPLSEAMLQRRAAGLDHVELTLLNQYGYPYVLERYRFHMTLSAPTTPADEQVLRTWLSSKIATLPPARIDALTICRESAPGNHFELIERMPLGRGQAV